MLRRSVVTLLVLAASLGVIVGSATSAGAAAKTTKPVTFPGTIHCTLAHGAAITSKPALLLSTARQVTITLSAKVAKCTGQTKHDGSTIVSGSATGTVKGDFSCTSLLSSFPAPKGSVTWKTKGKPAAKTSFSLSDGAYDLTTGALTYHALQKGSFPGHKTFKAVVAESATQLELACEVGLSKIPLKSGAFT